MQPYSNLKKRDYHLAKQSPDNFIHFRLAIDQGIAVLIVNRPQKLNALNQQAIDELMQLCRSIERNEDVGVVILGGEGKSFCAGGDIEAWSAESASNFGRRWLRDGHDAFDALTRLRQPVIAALNGHALGGGLELAACADYRIGETQIKIGQPESALGVIAGWSGTQRAVRRFGSQVVRRMALFGEVFNAEEALSLGIIDAIAETGQSMEVARQLAAKLLERGPLATEITKMLINAAENEEVERVLESLAGRLVADSAELTEGVTAFKEKRKPRFGEQT